MKRCSRIQLSKDLSLSRIVHGSWKLLDSSLKTPSSLLRFIETLVTMGVTSFDHADIYGAYSCEKMFGNALALKKSLRSQIDIITKCGIALPAQAFPKRTFKYYSYEDSYVKQAVEQSLQNFQTDYIDVLLLHRPSPFMDYASIAQTFNALKQEGKVLHFGVSNFSPRQFECLQSFCDMPLVTNQVEISAYHLDFFTNGNMEYLQKEKIHPMAWSPLASGKIATSNHSPEDEKAQRIIKALEEVTIHLSTPIGIDAVALAWLCSHPVGIIPVVGSCVVKRIENAVAALDVKLDEAQWLSIYTASTDRKLP